VKKTFVTNEKIDGIGALNHFEQELALQHLLHQLVLNT
jgi:hypothetical protein